MKTALVVIDVQEAMVKEGPYACDQVIKNIKHLIEQARSNNIEVIYVQHIGEAGSILEEDSEGWQIYHEIAPLTGEPIFTKHFNSAFRQTGLQSYLKEKEIERLILTGMQTEYCIDTTIKVAFEYGFDIVIPEMTNTTYDNELFTGQELYKYYNHMIFKNRFALVEGMEETLKRFSTITLKYQLKVIAENDYKLSSENNLDLLIGSMLNNIGSLDPELRDDLIYSTLSQLISSHQINDQQLKNLITSVMDENHLFYKINEEDDLAIYTRTFSILIVASALYRHREKAVFSPQEIKELFSKVVDYCKLEKDLRGYVEDYGWAHSAAHTADTLDELAMCSELSKEALDQLLEMIRFKVATGAYTYKHQEDERLVTAVMSIMGRNILGEEDLIDWIKSFDALAAYEEPMQNYAMQLNIKNFLRSLYFRLIKCDDKSPLLRSW